MGGKEAETYGEDACPSYHQCQTLAGDAGPVTGGGGLRVSKMGKLQDKGKLGKLGKFHVQAEEVGQDHVIHVKMQLTVKKTLGKWWTCSVHHLVYPSCTLTILVNVSRELEEASKIVSTSSVQRKHVRTEC